MYNGIGLTTPRGSGTSGYVVRNLSTLRSYQNDRDRDAGWDAAPPKHREPDQGILEHERKRAVEVKCLELQVRLEDEEVDEAEIEKQVSALREKLLANLNSSQTNVRGLKPSDTHALAAAKKVELEKMARALGTRNDYQEGDSFDKEKQEEMRLKRITEREDRDRRRAEDTQKFAEQKARWEAERRERDDDRRRHGDREDLPQGIGTTGIGAGIDLPYLELVTWTCATGLPHPAPGNVRHHRQKAPRLIPTLPFTFSRQI
ncbi:cwf21-domain-containing protein [Coprinellus micaceus]|uniref:Cwf21-domain-containing protein n=1 Tax=Coprinellus micaceus TaxID=71717 RepID=A0A4Y7TNB9_COPMI|nr:cwf21-domain-containing protein [Coprinellus micaceus]